MTTTCFRCGQAIQNIYEFQGHDYGPDCIGVVTGKNVESWSTKRVSGKKVIDEKETLRLQQVREANMALEARRQADIELCQKENAELIEAMKEMGVRYYETFGGNFEFVWQSSFCKSMHDMLQVRHLNEFSEKQVAAMQNVLAKWKKKPKK